MLSLFHILMLAVSKCRNFFFFFFKSLLVVLHIFPLLLSPSTFGAISFMPFSPLSHVPLSQASSMKVSCHCVRHICIAVPRGKQRLEEKRCVRTAWDRDAKRENESEEVWPVIYQNNGCLSDRKTSLHASFGILHHRCFIFIFFCLWQKNMPI